MKNLLLAVAITAWLAGSAMAQEYKDLQSAAYRSSAPPFEVSVPKECPGWHIRYAPLKGKPIIFVKTKSTEMPVIGTSVNFYDDAPAGIKQLWSDPYRILELVAADAERTEKELLRDVEVLVSQRVTIAGLSGYDRVFRSRAVGITYHYVYVLFPQAIVQFSLNAKTASFNEDNSDFIAIINSIKRL
ncbi:MAG TPA: hypothetical protein VMD52_06750 [Patescibacteria group bacterium]|nr:hypothetical protein [Patescibacteria group bacterium]